jgi:hypothetical protein
LSSVKSLGEFEDHHFTEVERSTTGKAIARRGTSSPPKFCSTQDPLDLKKVIDVMPCRPWNTSSHIDTELRVARRHGLEEGLAKHPNEIVPYKILPSAVDSVKQVVDSRLRLFNGKRQAIQGV